MVPKRSTPRENGLRSYRSVFVIKPARRFFAGSIPGRFGVATVGLATIVFVQHVAHSYQLAGTAVGVLAVSNAFVAPVAAHIAARKGQAVVLRFSAVLMVIAAAALTTVVSHHSRAILLGSVALIGAAMPQIGAIAVSRWSTLITTQAMRTALAVESMMTEITFLAGPAIISVAVSAWSPIVAPGISVGLIVFSALLLAAAHDSEPPRSSPGARSGSRLQHPALPVVLMAAANIAIGSFFGASQVSVIAAATRLGNLDIATAVYGVMSLTSLFAGLTYGAIQRTRAHAGWDLTASFLGLCVSAVWLTQTHALPPLVLLLLVSGVFVAPTIITTSVITEHATPPEHVNSTFTVLTSLQSLGSAVGSVSAGTLIDKYGAMHGFLVPGIATGVGAIVALTYALTRNRERDRL